MKRKRQGSIHAKGADDAVRRFVKITRTQEVTVLMDIRGKENYNQILDRIHSYLDSHGGAGSVITENETVYFDIPKEVYAPVPEDEGKYPHID